MMCRAFFGSISGRRKKLLVQQFPDALAMIVRSVRVGIPVIGAIGAVGHEAQAPTSIEFTRLSDELTVGVPLDEATTEMGVRNNLPEYRFFAIAIGLQARAGGGLSETLGESRRPDSKTSGASGTRTRVVIRSPHERPDPGRPSGRHGGGALVAQSHLHVRAVHHRHGPHDPRRRGRSRLSCGAFSHARTIIKKSLSRRTRPWLLAITGVGICC